MASRPGENGGRKNTGPRPARKICIGCGNRRRKATKPGPRCATCWREVSQERSAARKAKHLEDNFEITEEQYQEILAYQNGVCFICGKKPGRYKRLSVDHDHALAKVHDHPEDKGCPLCIRGLLHSKCNSFLGWIRDDFNAGYRMARYLIDPPARYVLVPEVLRGEQV